MIQWLPPTERSKENKGKRGWEKPDVKISGPSRGGGWLIRNLYEFIKNKDFKVICIIRQLLNVHLSSWCPQIQEAALTALAALYKDTPSVVTFMRRSLPEGNGK